MLASRLGVEVLVLHAMSVFEGSPLFVLEAVFGAVPG